MVRRSLGVALWSLVGLLACFLGALGALVGTAAGRRLLSRAAEGSLAQALAGTVEVGEVRGTLLTGLTLSDVRLFDADAELVVWLPEAELSYNPFDLAAGRVVLLELRLDRPLINLKEYANGRLNLEEVLRLGGPDTGPRRPPPLVVFRNVEIEQGRLIVRLLDRESPGDSLLEIERSEPAERRRVRRFERLDARLATLRLSSPRERGILAEVRHLAVTATDPAFALSDLRGRLLIHGDSITLDLDRVGMAGSSLRARGSVRWPKDTLLYALDLEADSATLTDFRFIDARFPAGAVLSGGIRLRSRGARVLEVRLEPLELRYRGGALSGRVTAISQAGQGLVAVRQADLEATEMDLELVRPFLDTLPFAGRLSGGTRADGLLSALALEVDWAFRDSLAEGWPVTTVRGRGEVNLEAADGLTFNAFSVDLAQVDLATVRRLIPTFVLEGALDAAGTLDGPYRNATFSGTLRHRDPGGPPSLVRGTVRLDTRGDTLGVYADVAADSLSFDGLRGSFPRLPLAGMASGTIRLAGRLDGLETHADLRGGGGRGGRVRGDGTLVLLAPRYAARDFTLRLDDVDLADWLPGAPRSRLTLAVSGSAEVDSGAPRRGRLEARLRPSVVAGALLDSGVARVRFDERRLVVDSLHVAQAGLVTTGAGALGWRAGEAGTLRFEFDADTLRSLDSLLVWLAGRGAAVPEVTEPLAGAARVSLVLDGSFAALAGEVEARVSQLRWRGWSVPGGEARFAWQPGPASTLDLAVRFDSLAHGRLGFGLAEFAARGTPDSLAWFGRSRVGDLAGFLAGGHLERRDRETGSAGIAVTLDSLALLLPGGVWFLEGPAEATVSDSVLRIEGFRLANANGPGRLLIEGGLPARGRAEANVQLESVPLAGIYALLQRDTLGVGGYLTATLALGGTRAEPTYRAALALNEGSFGRFRTPFLDGTVEYRDRRLHGTLNLWRSGQSILTVTAHLPLDLALAPVERRQLPDTLSVRARADSVDLSVLEAVTTLVREVRGGFSADVGIGGTWDAPRLSGGLQIAEAAAFIPALNVRYTDINGRLTLSGDSIRVEGLTLRGGEGRAEVSGAIRLERLTKPRLALTIDAREFRALDLRGFLSLTASARLALDGPVFGATLTGRGTVTSGVWYFADLVRKRVIDIDAPWAATLIDTSLAATIRRQRLGPQFESVFLDSLRIRDLDLAMGSDVWLRSTEANIQLTGTVRVNKEGDEYRLTGTLQAPRGVYRLTVGPVTREFTVTQGTVRYFGTPDLDAALNIEARHVVHLLSTQGGQAEEDTVIARIGGTLLVPSLTLAIEGREVAQTDIISYLMFGLSSDQLGGGAREAVVRSVAASLYGEVERALVSDLGVPLDYVEIRPTNPVAPGQGIRLAAGVQLGSKTFVVLKANLCGGQPVSPSDIGAGLQFRLSPEWRAEASVEPVLICGTTGTQTAAQRQQQYGFDLFWERRY
ncbi:MAG TPA: translocation/assembly module TamB domain-containing protein [Gemmatimonadales bacterium]|nr:translocation/assembly module TamB domain-containing protein [Gemmatimonadales bacterium]